VVLSGLSDSNGKLAATGDDSKRAARLNHTVHGSWAMSASRPRAGMQMGRLLSARMN
jgi:hypothetical protein